jgi:hypothetical protein
MRNASPFFFSSMMICENTKSRVSPHRAEISGERLSAYSSTSSSWPFSSFSWQAMQ